jgi:sugar phosphate isomerase/epimerase
VIDKHTKAFIDSGVIADVEGDIDVAAGSSEDITSVAAGISASGTTAICGWPTDERDLTHPETAARRRAVDYYRGCVDLASAVGAPLVGLIPTAVGRVAPLSDRDREWEWAVEGTREVALHAGERGVRVAVEAINRYETHLVNRVEQALELADATEVDAVDVIADAFHMQLEESDSTVAIEHAGRRLAALHVADSNRLGLGRGQLDVAPLVRAASRARRDVPLVLECTAPGPNPFDADKGPGAMPALDAYVRDSARTLRRLLDGDD